MSEIFQFLTKNYERLTVIDWGLVIFVSAFASIGLFVIFRWLYDARYKAQSELIGIQNDSILRLKERIEERQSELDGVRGRLSDVSQRLMKAEENSQQYSEAISRLYGLAVQMQTAILFSQRVTLVYQRMILAMIGIYYYETDAVAKQGRRLETRTIVERIRRLDDELFAADNEFGPFFEGQGLNVEATIDYEQAVTRYRLIEASAELQNTTKLLSEFRGREE